MRNFSSFPFAKMQVYSSFGSYHITMLETSTWLPTFFLQIFIKSALYNWHVVYADMNYKFVAENYLGCIWIIQITLSQISKKLVTIIASFYSFHLINLQLHFRFELKAFLKFLLLTTVRRKLGSGFSYNLVTQWKTAKFTDHEFTLLRDVG